MTTRPTIDFRFTNTFSPVFKSKARYIDIWGGRGRGGSHFGTEYFLFKITQPEYFRGYFVRQSFTDIRDSLFRDFKDRIAENQTLNSADFHIRENDMRITYLPTGNTILSKGVAKDGSRTAKMKSLAGATHVLIEEADELAESDFDQLDLSLRTTKAQQVQIIRIFNPPPKRHWIWRDYVLTESEIPGFFKAEAKTNVNLLSIHSTYRSNFKNINSSTVSKFESFKESNPEYYYTQIRGLISEGAKGRIYSGWQPITDEQFNDIDAPIVYGVDFGYSNDPTAVVAVKYVGQYRYVKEIIYETGLDNLQLALRLRAAGITKADLLIADSGGGGDLRIAELRRGWPGYGDLRFNIYPAIKGSGSILYGIGCLKSVQIYLTESSSNGWHEFGEYKWRLDADKNPTDTPIDADNHFMDALRYVELYKNRQNKFEAITV